MSFIDPFEPVVLTHPDFPISAEVIPLGLNITRLVLRDASTGETHDVITAPEDPRDHWKKGRKFLGPLVGRYANRVPSGKITFAGKELEMPAFPNSGVCLHGGPELHKTLPQIPVGQITEQDGPLDRVIWCKITKSQSRLFGDEPHQDSSPSTAIFAVVSAAGSCGFPGKLLLEALVAVQQPNPSIHVENGHANGKQSDFGVLRVEYRATILDDCEATPINVTQHWGFNLSASNAEARKAEKGTTDDHTLRIIPIKEATELYTLQLDEQLVPLGGLISCSRDGEHDWTQEGPSGMGRPIKEKMTAVGYDHFYAWGAAEGKSDQDEIERHARVLLHSPATGVTLSFKTNQSGVQFYHSTGQPDHPAPPQKSGGQKKLLHEDNQDSPSGYAKRTMAVLEFAHPHATFLHKDYQSLAKNDTVLRKSQTYRNWVEIELCKKSS